MTRRITVIATPLVLTLLASVASAQVNIESLRRSDAATGLTGSVALDVAIRAGNVDFVQLTLTGRTDYSRGQFSTFVVGSGDLGFQGGQRFANAGLLHVRQSYAIGFAIPEAYAQVNYTRQQQLAFRGLVGGGLRVPVVRHARVRLWFGSGPMFEHERLDLPLDAVHPRRTSVARWTSYLSSKLTVDPRVVLLATTYLQTQVGDWGDVRNLTDVDLAVGLGRAASLVISFDLRYDSRPPDDTDPVDTTLKTGLAVTF